VGKQRYVGIGDVVIRNTGICRNFYVRRFEV
jgi:hypothetical protein